jgi:hypothetical protein
MIPNINTTSTSVNVSVKQFLGKFRSKAEIWKFVSIDCKAYLPAFNTVSVYFLRDLLQGKKKSK